MSRRRWALAAVALIAIVVLIGACGSSAATGAGNGGTANADKGVEFAACMRSHGVSEFPDPGTGGKFTIDGVVNGSSLHPNAPAFKEALSACQALEPSGFMGPKRNPQQMEAALKFAQCIRANGVPNFPDPTRNGPLVDVSNGQSIPGLHLAMAKCRSFMLASNR